jgi:hypothetical protein
MSDARTEAIERTVEDIERELRQRLDMHQRIAITRALEQLASDAAQRRPWPDWA